jgi:DNA repair photolyase
LSNSSSTPGPDWTNQPANRFERIHVEEDLEHRELDPEFAAPAGRRRIHYLEDDTQSIISENESPDLPFRFSMNPYRGCVHGCSYCYARPTHEYLGLNAGVDFETQVLVKRKAPQLFRDYLASDFWDPSPIMMSGVTDCYQPAERTFRLTRQCLEVAWDARQPMMLVTKNALVNRDADLLRAMAACHTADVAISITTLDRSLSRAMEPGTSTPEARLRAITELTSAGIPTSVMIAPVIPGLNDAEIPAILRSAAACGAVSAGCQILRLPLTVRPVFLQWLASAQPTRRRRVEARIRAVREGRWSDSRFGSRLTGKGEMAGQIGELFRVFASRYGLDRQRPPLDTSQFRRPTPAGIQLRLF